jgi:hypothetical protein
MYIIYVILAQFCTWHERFIWSRQETSSSASFVSAEAQHKPWLQRCHDELPLPSWIESLVGRWNSWSATGWAGLQSDVIKSDVWHFGWRFARCHDRIRSRGRNSWRQQRRLPRQSFSWSWLKEQRQQRGKRGKFGITFVIFRWHPGQLESIEIIWNDLRPIKSILLQNWLSIKREPQELLGNAMTPFDHIWSLHDGCVFC